MSNQRVTSITLQEALPPALSLTAYSGACEGPGTPGQVPRWAAHPSHRMLLRCSEEKERALACSGVL